MYQRKVPAADCSISFRTVFCVLVAKLLLFTQLVNLGRESFLPVFGAITGLLALSFFIDNCRWNFIYLAFVNTALSVLFFCHALYYRYFTDFASIYDIEQIHQLVDVSSAVVSLIGVNAMLVADLFLVPFLYRSRKKAVQTSKGTYGLLTATVFILSGIVLNVTAVTDNLNTGNNYFVSFYSRHDFVKYMGIINYQIADMYYFLVAKFQKSTIDKSDIDAVMEWRTRRRNVPWHHSHSNGVQRANLIVIQVESMQNFVINKSYAGREITPHLNKLARTGLYFNNVYDQTAAGNSSDATFLANCSLYPAKRGAVAFLYAQNRFDSLPALLKENGYATAVMEPYKKNFWNNARFDHALGFDVQFYEDAFDRTEKLGWALSDKSFLSQGAEKMTTMPVPFYVLLRTITTHAPFTAVSERIDNFPLQGLDGEEIGRYLRSMHYVDAAFGKFLQQLEGAGLLSNTVIVVYGDHRARLATSGLKKIGVTDRTEDKKIPLIISYPGVKSASIRKSLGGLIDLAPTICSILGIDSRGRMFLGNDLTGQTGRYVIFRDGTFLTADGSVDREFAYNQLKLSDLIVEKDILNYLGNARQ